MKTITCMMFVLCLCLLGFAVGRQSVDVYLNDDEAVWIQRRCNVAHIWVYTWDSKCCNWKVERTKLDEYALTGINVHFIEPLVF